MKRTHWMLAVIVALGMSASSASAQNFPTRDFSPKNLSSALTGVDPSRAIANSPDPRALASGASAPASNVSRSRFSIGSLFPRLSGTSVTKGPQQAQNFNPGFTGGGSFNPVLPIMGTVPNVGRTVGLSGRATSPGR